MPTRRDFFKQAAFGGIPLALANGLGAGQRRFRRPSRIHLGAQTNAWGVPIEGYDHLVNIFDALERLGFDGFETNFKTMEPFAARPGFIRQAFESRQLRFVASHNGSTLYDKAGAAAEIESLRRKAALTAAMGASYFIVSGRRLPHSGGQLDRNAVAVWTDSLNRLGKVVRREGLKLCYHNHSQEFLDHPTQMSFFWRDTDPDLVWLNFDDGHAAGLIPSVAAFSAAHYHRIAIYHLKDMKRVPGGPDGKFVETAMGAGQVNLRGMIEPLTRSHWEGWLENEEDFNYPKPIPDPEGVLRQWITFTRGLIGG